MKQLAEVNGYLALMLNSTTLRQIRDELVAYYEDVCYPTDEDAGKVLANIGYFESRLVEEGDLKEEECFTEIVNEFVEVRKVKR